MATVTTAIRLHETTTPKLPNRTITLQCKICDNKASTILKCYHAVCSDCIRDENDERQRHSSFSPTSASPLCPTCSDGYVDCRSSCSIANNQVLKHLVGESQATTDYKQLQYDVTYDNDDYNDNDNDNDNYGETDDQDDNYGENSKSSDILTQARLCEDHTAIDFRLKKQTEAQAFCAECRKLVCMKCVQKLHIKHDLKDLSYAQKAYQAKYEQLKTATGAVHRLVADTVQCQFDCTHADSEAYVDSVDEAIQHFDRLVGRLRVAFIAELQRQKSVDCRARELRMTALCEAKQVGSLGLRNLQDMMSRSNLQELVVRLRENYEVLEQLVSVVSTKQAEQDLSEPADTITKTKTKESESLHNRIMKDLNQLVSVVDRQFADVDVDNDEGFDIVKTEADVGVVVGVIDIGSAVIVKRADQAEAAQALQANPVVLKPQRKKYSEPEMLKLESLAIKPDSQLLQFHGILEDNSDANRVVQLINSITLYPENAKRFTEQLKVVVRQIKEENELSKIARCIHEIALREKQNKVKLATLLKELQSVKFNYAHQAGWSLEKLVCSEHKKFATQVKQIPADPNSVMYRNIKDRMTNSVEFFVILVQQKTTSFTTAYSLMRHYLGEACNINIYALCLFLNKVKDLLPEAYVKDIIFNLSNEYKNIVLERSVVQMAFDLTLTRHGT